MVRKEKITEKTSRRRLVIASILIIFFMLFIVINVEYKAGFIFLALAGVSALIILNWDKIPKKRPERKLFSFDENWIQDGVFGILIGLGIVFLMTLFPVASIFVPQVPQAGAFPDTFATAGQFITVVGAASLAEELAFRVVLFGLLWSAVGLSFFWATFHTSWVFSLFHINSYAGQLALSPILAVSAAFITAFIISFVFVFINRARGSISTSIGSHSAINGGIVSQQFIVVG